MTLRRFSFLPYLLAILIIGGIGYYGFTKFQILSTAKAEIKNYNDILIALETEAETIQVEHSAAEEEALKNSKKRSNELDIILPEGEALTDITRVFDDFFSIKNHTANDPLYLSSLNFESVINNEEWDYSVLPVRMSIQSSRKKFFKFLDWIENSGSFENPLRVMAIKNISINFVTEERAATTEGEAPNELIDFNVNLDVYFKKQIENKEQDSN